jgi:hypothetical protein
VCCALGFNADLASGKEKNMNIRNLVVVVVVMARLVPQVGYAEGKPIGKHSQDEIRKACNAAGGELLGISEHGSYGCEVASNGTMILCNKNQECKGYTSARSNADRKRVLNGLRLSKKQLK